MQIRTLQYGGKPPADFGLGIHLKVGAWYPFLQTNIESHTPEFSIHL